MVSLVNKRDLEKTVQQLITPLLAVVQKQMSLNRKLNISCIDSEKSVLFYCKETVVANFTIARYSW